MDTRNLFREQTKNVQYLKKIQNVLRKDINQYLKKNDTFSVKYKTLQYAHLYSALSEAEFLQLLFTPNKFTDADITKIQSQGTIIKKWKKMIKIAFGKITPLWSSDHNLQSKHNFIIQLVNDYVEKPQKLRNKIAHGQWLVALNSDNSNVNADTTNDLAQLDMVKISIWFEVHQSLCKIIRDLVQSANNTFLREFNNHCTKLQTYLTKVSTWNIADKICILKKKREVA